MTIDDLIALTQNRLVALNAARTAAFASGDISQINDIDTEILKSQTTLSQLLSIKAAT